VCVCVCVCMCERESMYMIFFVSYMNKIVYECVCV
jgi:hypothetical protein